MMLKLRSTSALLTGIGLLTLTGCYSYHPYGTHPGMMAPNGAPMFPPMQAPPQSTFVMPGDTVGSPSNGAVPSAPQSTFIPDSQLEAPEPGNAGGSAAPVPTPREPGESASSDPAGAATSQFQSPRASGAAAVVQGQPDLLQFQEPVVLAQAEPQSPVVAVSAEEVLENPENSGFAHDPDYRWLQGEVEYDPQNRSWHILFDLDPHPADQLGGEVQLVGRVPADVKYSGTKLRVSGRFDSRVDRLGKNLYVVEHLEAIE